MILIICIILFIWACDVSAQEHDNEVRRKRDYETAERRHREKLEALHKRPETRRKVTRTVAKDEHGRCVAQEIVEEVPDRIICFDDDWNIYYDDE